MKVFWPFKHESNFRGHLVFAMIMWVVTLGKIRHRPYLFYAEFQTAFYLLIFSWHESFVWDYRVICFISEQDLCV